MNEIKKILFSPIGGSDPINAGYDGSWLHCCRHYQPDLTVIYLSAEMLGYADKDQRFSRALEKLNALTGHEIALRSDPHPDLHDPQLFDYFYNDFETALFSLHKEFPEAELLVNASSGTPAMKACLVHLYHMLPFPIQMIQVAGPHKEMSARGKRETTTSPDYDVDDAWENNLDNLEDAQNRCHPLRDDQQALRLQEMQIKTLINRNEYYAALSLADQLDAFLPADGKACLRAAVDRQQLALYAAGRVLFDNGFSEGQILMNRSKDILFQGAEMTLTMQCDLDRDDIASCVRKLTPVLFSLIVSYLKHLGVDVMLFCDKDFKFDAAQMQAAYPDLYSSAAKATDLAKKLYVSHGFLISILDNLTDSLSLKSAFSKLRDLEGGDKWKSTPGVRNEVAHKPVKMTEKDFMEKSGGITPKDMMKSIRGIFEKLEPNLFNKAYWNSYAKMNDFLLKKLQRV